MASQSKSPAGPSATAQTVGAALASNIRALRSLRYLSQDGVAERMRFLGHDWSRTTVSEVERHARKVAADELISLAIVLNATLAELGDTHGRPIKLGDMDEITPEQVTGLLNGQQRIGLDWLGAGMHHVRQSPA